LAQVKPCILSLPTDGRRAQPRLARSGQADRIVTLVVKLG